MNIVLEYSDEFAEDWPLGTDEISILDTNLGSLVDVLDLTDLLSLLYSSKVINTRQKNSISSKPTSHERNHALLGILRRRSLGDYKQTIRCLRETRQGYIAEILEFGGGRFIDEEIMVGCIGLPWKNQITH